MGKVQTIRSLMAETMRLVSYIEALRKTFSRRSYGPLTAERLEDAEKRVVLLYSRIKDTRFKYLVPKESIRGFRRLLLNARYMRRKKRILKLIKRIRLFTRKSIVLLSKGKFKKVYRQLSRAESTGRSAYRAMLRLEARLNTELNTATRVQIQIQKRQMKM